MARSIWKALIALGVIAALLILFGVFVTLREPKFAAVIMPNPNGYDDLLFAAQLVTAAPILGTNLANVDQLAKSVAENAEALRTARRALSNDCRVRLEDSFGRSLRLGTAPPSFRSLGEAFRVEGRLAELDNRPGDAAQSYLAIIKLGQEVVRGGVLIDAMIGSSIEASGLASLDKVSNQLTAEQCKLTVSALASADRKRETVQKIVHQEKTWTRRTYGWRYYMHPIVNAQARHRAGIMTEQSNHARKLTIKLAERAFELDHGAKPKSINDLVPNYLKMAPKDAFTGKDMTYPP